MYSRSVGRLSYQGSRPHLHVPPNYSGTAIGVPPPDGVPPATDGLPLPSVPDAESLPSDVPSSHTRPSSASDEVLQETDHADSGLSEKPASPAGLFSGKHFPFGHGLGTEELLLLGLILFLLHEDEGKENDSDLSMTVLLLGALLFLG